MFPLYQIAIHVVVEQTTLKEFWNRILRTIFIWSLFCLKRLYVSVFSTVSFRKLVFRLSVLSLNQDIKYVSSCHIILACNFVLTLYKKSPFINRKLFIRTLTRFQRCLVFFEKNSFKKKIVEQSKNKECKKRYHKEKIGCQSFQVCISIVYDSFFWNLALALVLALHCYCGDNVKYGLLSRHLLQRKRQYGGWKNLTVATNF